jgi:flagellar hook-associated protein FlgK
MWGCFTTEERFERIAQVTAGIAEEQRRFREETHQLWRDTQRQLNEAASRINDLTLKVADANERMDRMDEQSRAADNELRERIAALVSANSQWMARELGPALKPQN